VAKFSFLMVLLPIIGAGLLDILDIASGTVETGIGTGSLVIGFLAAYLSGLAACSWMIRLVKKGNLYWFAAYCVIIGIISLVLA
jgi:undecaprenyl-diphosphatase